MMAIKVSLSEYAGLMKAMGKKRAKLAVGITLNRIGKLAKNVIKSDVSKELAQQTVLYASGLHRRGLSVKIEIKNTKEVVVPAKRTNVGVAGNFLAIARKGGLLKNPKAVLNQKGHFASLVYNKREGKVKGIFVRKAGAKRVLSNRSGKMVTLPIEMKFRLVDKPSKTVPQMIEPIIRTWFDRILDKEMTKSFYKALND
jgi:hypothetical protein